MISREMTWEKYIEDKSEDFVAGFASGIALIGSDLECTIEECLSSDELDELIFVTALIRARDGITARYGMFVAQNTLDDIYADASGREVLAESARQKGGTI